MRATKRSYPNHRTDHILNYYTDQKCSVEDILFDMWWLMRDYLRIAAKEKCRWPVGCAVNWIKGEIDNSLPEIERDGYGVPQWAKENGMI